MRDTRIKQFMSKFAVPLVFLLFIILIQVVNPHKTLLSWENVKNIFIQSSILGFISLGLSMILICGEIDMSLAGSIGLIGTTFSYALLNGMSAVVAALIALGVGLIVWFSFTLLVAKYRFSSIIVSICLMFICMGGERLYNDGKTIWIKDSGITSMATMEIFGIPVLVLVLIVAYCIFYFVINQTKFGFKARVVGENEKAALEVGISPQGVKSLAFLLAFLMYIAGSIIEPIRVGGSQIYAGNRYLLPAMAASFLGSSMFYPGRVNLMGTFIGSIFMGFILNFLTILGIRFYFVPLTQGVLLLVGVGIATVRNRSINQIKL